MSKGYKTKATTLEMQPGPIPDSSTSDATSGDDLEDLLNQATPDTAEGLDEDFDALIEAAAEAGDDFDPVVVAEDWPDPDEVALGWKEPLPVNDDYVLSGAAITVSSDTAAADQTIADLASTDDLLTWLNDQGHDEFKGDAEFLAPEDAFLLYSDDGADIQLPTGTVGEEQFADVYAAWVDGYAEVPEHTKQLAQAYADWVKAKDDPTLSLTEKFDALQTYGDTARALFEANGLDLNSEQWKALKAETKEWLHAKSHAEIKALAHHAGFKHPLLASGTHPDNTPKPASKAVVGWLDPAYGEADSHYKTVIQAKALDRYQQLKDGTLPDYMGITLQQVDADNAANAPAHAVPPTPHGQTWVVDADGFAELQELHKKGYAGNVHNFQEKLNARLELRWKLKSAVPGEGVTQFQLDQLDPVISHYQIGIGQLPTIAKLTGVDEESLHYLKKPELVALADPTTEADTVASHLEAAAKRKAIISDNKATWTGTQQLWDQVQTSQSLNVGQWNTLVEVWKPGKAHKAELFGTHWDDIDGNYAVSASIGTPDDQSMRDVLKKVSLKDLRAVAKAMGMENSGPPTTRAAIQNYLIGHAHGDDSAMNKAKAKAASSHAPAPVVTSAAPGSSQQWPPPTSPGKVPSAAKPQVSSAQAVGTKIVKPGWGSELSDLSDLLSHAQATRADIPKRDEAAAATMQLTTKSGVAPTGGSHSTTGFVDGTGQKWFGKPHSSGSGGAAETRAVTEAIASKAKSELGLAAIPVYHRKIGSQHHALQPVIDAKPLSSHEIPNLSQHDVDTIVRQHVGDWVIGEHDGKEDNWMRTKSGGLVRCDLGQAFKFFGADSSSLGWEANGNYGTPLIKQLVAADKAGTLAKGVRVDPSAALGVIGKAESISDAQWEAVVRPVAEAGVKDGGDAVRWVKTMRAKAAKRHGVADFQVTDDQVVDEFIAEANRRRSEVRKDISEAFAEQGYDTTPLQHL